jgi:uncharacterized protein DUF955
VRKAENSRAFVRIGNRVWHHPSVLALVEEYGRRIDPSTIIRARARTLVARARQCGWDGPPYDPRVLASSLGIKIHARVLAPGHEACIFPGPGQQLELVFDKTRPITRQNFSISHEIAHTLFPDSYEMVRNRYRARDQFDPDRELEHLCDLGAAELLLPEDVFRVDLDLLGFGLLAVDPLRKRYEASREAVIRRMIQFATNVSAAVFLEHRLKPSEVAAQRQLSLVSSDEEPQPKLRIAYSVPSQNFDVFLPPHKSVPADSCAYRALASREVVFAREQWEIPGLPECDVQAMAMPTGDDVTAPPKAVALLRV